MKYLYRCKECNYQEEIERPMGSSLPKDLSCKECGKKTLNRDFKEVLSSAIKIPYHMKAVSGDAGVRYDKMSRSEKTYY